MSTVRFVLTVYQPYRSDSHIVWLLSMRELKDKEVRLSISLSPDKLGPVLRDIGASIKQKRQVS